ncbi:Uncharacterised protein [Chlamydia trachomatis]|nr:Uncharacterised protein [Chlamydia trachomatis]
MHTLIPAIDHALNACFPGNDLPRFTFARVASVVVSVAASPEISGLTLSVSAGRGAFMRERNAVPTQKLSAGITI